MSDPMFSIHIADVTDKDKAERRSPTITVSIPAQQESVRPAHLSIGARRYDADGYPTYDPQPIDPVETDAAFRERIMQGFADELKGGRVIFAVGDELDAIGLRYGLKRAGAPLQISPIPQFQLKRVFPPELATLKSLFARLGLDDQNWSVDAEWKLSFTGPRRCTKIIRTSVELQQISKFASLRLDEQAKTGWYVESISGNHSTYRVVFVEVIPCFGHEYAAQSDPPTPVATAVPSAPSDDQQQPVSIGEIWSRERWGR